MSNCTGGHELHTSSTDVRFHRNPYLRVAIPNRDNSVAKKLDNLPVVQLSHQRHYDKPEALNRARCTWLEHL